MDRVLRDARPEGLSARKIWCPGAGSYCVEGTNACPLEDVRSEQGHGLSVVADEVLNLAMRAWESVQQIQAMLKNYSLRVRRGP